MAASVPRRMMGTAGVAARRRPPEENFGVWQYRASRQKFRDIETILRIERIDKTFRRDIMEMLSEYLAFKAMWLGAPKRMKIHDELRGLKTTCRRQPENVLGALATLRPETLHRLNLCGLDDETPANALPTIIEAALIEVPKDTGGRAVNEHHRFLVEQFGKLYEQHARQRPTLAYREDTDEYEGAFLKCLVILFEILPEKAPTNRALAQLFKRLFYNTN